MSYKLEFLTPVPIHPDSVLAGDVDHYFVASGWTFIVPSLPLLVAESAPMKKRNSPGSKVVIRNVQAWRILREVDLSVLGLPPSLVREVEGSDPSQDKLFLITSL